MKKGQAMATITFDGSGANTRVQVGGTGYENDRTISVNITKPDGSEDTFNAGVFGDGHTEYAYDLGEAGTYHFAHFQRKHAKGNNQDMELKAEADLEVS